MSADLFTESESVAAARWALHAGRPIPAEVAGAMKAKADLHARIAEDGYRDPTRDEKRLRARYERTIAAHDAAVLAAFRESTTAPTETQEGADHA